MRLLVLLILSLSLPGFAAEVRPEDHARLETLSQELNIPLEQLVTGMQQAQFRQSVLDAIQRPWEAKPWYQYRPLFITPDRIRQGVAFWRKNASQLDRAAVRMQVPPEVVVAIIGIETYFGTRMGNHPVLDALYTLGFHYPERAPYFSKEFAQFVRLANEQKWPLRQPMGSYAGAMGMGQFMPTSYLHFAVDFDNDGHKDLFANPADAIGSVANYFAEHGWHYGEPVATPATLITPLPAGILTDNPDLIHSWKQLHDVGVRISTDLPADTPVKLLRLEQPTGNEYWVVRHNFYVITRYNRSPLYAMAVYQLSQELAHAYHAQ
ncbi:MAG: lytic murein transglycosylase B [Aeromonadaceae bacterium]